MVKIGIIGLGGMGNMHFGVYERTAGAEVVALADTDENKLKPGESSQAINIGEGGATIDPDKQKLYTDAGELLKDPDVDMVDICLPTFLHTEYMLRAIEAGKHVLCEKPMALTYEDCQKVLDALEGKKDIRLMIAQCIRFWPEYAYLKGAVESGRLGRVRSAHFWRGGSVPDWSWQGWLKDVKRSGGAIMDLHVHDADFVHYLLGRPRAVCSTGAIRYSGGYDAVDTVYIYEDKISVHAGAHMGLPTAFGFEMRYAVAFEKACLTFNKTHPEVKHTDGYHEEIAYFVHCLANNELPAVVSPESAAFSVKLAETEVRSVTTGQALEI